MLSLFVENDRAGYIEYRMYPGGYRNTRSGIGLGLKENFKPGTTILCRQAELAMMVG